MLPAPHGKLGFSQVQGHKPGCPEQNLLSDSKFSAHSRHSILAFFTHCW